jgi:hypothetical protein
MPASEELEFDAARGTFRERQWLRITRHKLLMGDDTPTRCMAGDAVGAVCFDTLATSLKIAGGIVDADSFYSGLHKASARIHLHPRPAKVEHQNNQIRWIFGMSVPHLFMFSRRVVHSECNGEFIPCIERTTREYLLPLRIAVTGIPARWFERCKLFYLDAWEYSSSERVPPAPASWHY